ncbi:MAG: DNA/RNA non-specific endonuclease [Rhodospirillales bacterium]|nr:DNA/RNA non-specific endonuclease [Rhodospirillales bacterium]
MKYTCICIFVLLAVLALPVSAAETCGCDISSDTRAEYDAALIETDAADVSPLHAPWGTPVGKFSGTRIVELAQAHWLTGYDVKRRLPLWVAYRLTSHDVAKKRKRTQCFRPDPRVAINDGGTVCASYKGDGMDRGHMVPSADMTRSERAMVNSYIFTNIAHQYPGFNRTLWRDLEIRVRTMARISGEIYVVTGAIFDRDDDGRPDRTGLAAYPIKSGNPKSAVATHFYKVVFVAGEGSDPPKITAWLFRHKNVRTSGQVSAAIIDKARVPLSVIEKLSGLDIAPALNIVSTARH